MWIQRHFTERALDEGKRLARVVEKKEGKLDRNQLRTRSTREGLSVSRIGGRNGRRRLLYVGCVWCYVSAIKSMSSVYISSTYGDLKEHRAAVAETLRRCDYNVDAMEKYAARDDRPKPACEADATNCDIYVGIFAWR